MHANAGIGQIIQNIPFLASEETKYTVAHFNGNDKCVCLSTNRNWPPQSAYSDSCVTITVFKNFLAKPGHQQPQCYTVNVTLHTLFGPTLGRPSHYNDVIMGAMASQITSLTIVYSNDYSGANKKTPKLRVTGFCAGNSPVTGEFPAQRASNAEMFPFDDVIIGDPVTFYRTLTHVKRD